jgi:threonine dehydrogenase-like Zn-dependent dehydrogenase
MRALVFGTATQPFEPPPGAPQLVRNLASTPCALVDLPDARPLRPDWYVIRPLLTGICGSDSKQILMDFEGDADSPMSAFVSFPQVLGHEVVGEVVDGGPEAAGFGPGDRVVLNPWLACAARGVDPACPACRDGDFSLCWNFTSGPLAKGLHTGTSSDATGGYAELMPAHSSMLFKVPEGLDDRRAVLADPFAVSLHSVTRHPPPSGGRVLVWGAGALGCAAVAALRCLHPDVEVGVVARFDAQADLARDLGAHAVFRPTGLAEMVQQLADWSGGVLKPPMEGLDAVPMCHPGFIDVAYDTIGKPETFEVEVRVLRARGTLVKSGVHAPGRWEWSPLYFKELQIVGSNAFGMEEVRGVKRHGIEHYMALASTGEVDLSRMVTHAFGLSEWQAAFAALGDQASSGAIKVTIDPSR